MSEDSDEETIFMLWCVVFVGFDKKNSGLGTSWVIGIWKLPPRFISHGFEDEYLQRTTILNSIS